eukprot:scaffold2622_cov165-Skeletonema_marinoi.AAC.1
MRGQDSSFSSSSSGGCEASQQLHLLHRDYIYAPTHSLNSELCMILQTRYFLLLDEEYDNNQGSIPAAADKHEFVKEISFDEYKSRTTPWNSGYRLNKNKVVMATEVAFAPK